MNLMWFVLSVDVIFTKVKHVRKPVNLVCFSVLVLAKTKHKKLVALRRFNRPIMGQLSKIIEL